MTGDADDEISPWQRDDWTGASDGVSTDDFTDPLRRTAVDPTVVGRGVVEQVDPPGAPSPSNPPRRTQVVIAGLLGVGLLVAGTVALVRADNDPDLPAEPTVPSSAPVLEEVTPTDPIAVDGVSDTSSTGYEGPVDVARAAVGEVPMWTEWMLDVPSPLAAVAPTELVALSADRVLHRVVFPSGRVRSLSLDDIDAVGIDLRLVVEDGAILLYAGRTVLLIRVDEPILEVPAGDGVIFAQPGPATGTFLVTTAAGASSASVSEAQEWILGVDGTLTSRESRAFQDDELWSRSFLPTGELLVNRAGGVYAISPDETVTRVSAGDLLALGANHYAVEECDDDLVCSQYVVDAATGDRTAAAMESLAWASFVDPSNRLSPDGRFLVFSDVTRGTGIRQIVDTETGATRDIGPVTAIALPDTWASDGSGLFEERDGIVRFHSSAATPTVQIDGLGPISAIGVHAVSD